MVTPANYLQQAADDHAASLGVSSERLARRGLGWVLARQLLQIQRFPKVGDQVLVETWPSHRARQVFHRDFTMTDEDGGRFAVATSAWALFDLAERKAVTSPSRLADSVRYDPVRAARFATRTVVRLRVHDWERPVLPRWIDLDLNGHVNNAQLIGWVLEALPRAVLEKGCLREIDAVFRSECRLEDEVLSRAARVATDGREIVRAETLWLM